MLTYYLAIDIGGTDIKFGLITDQGDVFDSFTYKTPTSLDGLKVLLEGVLSKRVESLKGVGISVPGKVDTLSGVIFNGGSLDYLDGFKMKEFLENQFDLSVYVQNDGKAAVLGEYWKGNLKGIDYGAGIILGTGVGGGIIINGKILNGENFQAGEFSFMLNSVGKVTNHNLIANAASAVKFINNANDLLGNHERNDGKFVFDQLNMNENDDLLNLFETYCEQIVFIILNLQAILDIKRIVIGGGISSQDNLINCIKTIYDSHKKNHKLFDSTLNSVEIVACKFKGQANLIGAVFPFFERKF